MQCAHGAGLHLTVYSLCTLHIISQVAPPSVGVWAIGVQHLKCPGCTWASWSLPAPASPLRASVSPPPRSCCLLHRPSESPDYEHKSSTCQELLLPGLCNVPAFIWRWPEQETAANVLRSFKCYPSISFALMRGLWWWQWLSETTKVFKILEFTLYIGNSSVRSPLPIFSFNPE